MLWSPFGPRAVTTGATAPKTPCALRLRQPLPWVSTLFHSLTPLLGAPFLTAATGSPRMRGRKKFDSSSSQVGEVVPPTSAPLLPRSRSRSQVFPHPPTSPKPWTFLVECEWRACATRAKPPHPSHNAPFPFILCSGVVYVHEYPDLWIRKMHRLIQQW